VVALDEINDPNAAHCGIAMMVIDSIVINAINAAQRGRICESAPTLR
jgi:hypothetical protein